MLNDFYKIGQVIEVRGQKLRIRVFENKNSNILIYQGKIIKNVSVGSFVKIPKGFSNIIGKIEGEYIQESSLPTNNAKSNRFSKESETIDRIIEVSIMGVLDNDRFRRGLIDIPLVFSDVFILDDNEVQKIFDYFIYPDFTKIVYTESDFPGMVPANSNMAQGQNASEEPKKKKGLFSFMDKESGESVKKGLKIGAGLLATSVLLAASKGGSTNNNSNNNDGKKDYYLSSECKRARLGARDGCVGCTLAPYCSHCR